MASTTGEVINLVPQSQNTSAPASESIRTRSMAGSSAGKISNHNNDNSDNNNSENGNFNYSDEYQHYYRDDPSSASSTTDQSSIILPPRDGGFGAWKFLTAVFVLETIVWSIPFSYGVLLNFYLSTDFVAGSSQTARTLLSLVGTISSGIMYCSGPAVVYVINRYPQFRRPFLWIGLVLCSAGMLASSWASQPWHLVMTAGVTYGIGGSIMYYPAISYLTEWFDKRRGLANGVVFAGTAVGGLILPFVLNALTDSYGIATTWRALGVTVTVMLVGVTPLILPRDPRERRLKKDDDLDQEQNTNEYERQVEHSTLENTIQNRAKSNTPVWKSSTVWMVLIANVCQALGYFVPTLYIPNFATSLDLANSEGSAALSAINAAGVISRVLMGVASDKYSIHSLAACTLIGAALSVFLLWGLASTSFAPLIVFSVFFGFLSGGWTSLWMGAIRETTKNDRDSANTMYGVLSLTRGIGNILVAPIGAALTSTTQSLPGLTVGGFAVGDGRYAGLVLFAGAMMGIAGLAEAVATGLKWHNKLKV